MKTSFVLFILHLKKPKGRNVVLPLFYELRRKGQSLQESNEVHPQKSIESSNKYVWYYDNMHKLF